MLLDVTNVCSLRLSECGTLLITRVESYGCV